jgi:uncharacterized iron-regulated membrane protein
LSYLTRTIRFVRHWHARLGVLLVVFFLILAITGLALNHTDALGLSKREVNSPWLMRWYGLKPVLPSLGYLFKDGYLVAADEHWVMDGHPLPEAKLSPVGAISWGNMRAIADADNLYLFMADGQVIDKLTGTTLPGKPIEQLGSIGSVLVLKTAQGSFVTSDGLTWQLLAEDASGSNQVSWSARKTLPDTITERLNEILAPSLPLERIVLDLHSGRIFGRYGFLLMDIAALGMAMLSLSGAWIYLRSMRRKK